MRARAPRAGWSARYRCGYATESRCKYKKTYRNSTVRFAVFRRTSSLTQVNLVSRPGELRPEAPAEPYVRLAPHTAPVIQPIHQRHASGQTTEGIGEVGLDGSPRFRKSIELQERISQAAFTECGRQGGKIVSIHSRGAAQRTIEALAKAHDVGYPVLHWFSGGVSELRTAARLGCWFSVGPAMLAGEKGRGLLSHMPLDRVLPETDGPFATEGGVPLKPWDAWKICTTLSDVWAMPRSAVEEQLRTNLKRLLGSQTCRQRSTV